MIHVHETIQMQLTGDFSDCQTCHRDEKNNILFLSIIGIYVRHRVRSELSKLIIFIEEVCTVERLKCVLD
jgi:hypothetical protein